jgi:hypothetical protein
VRAIEGDISSSLERILSGLVAGVSNAVAFATQSDSALPFDTMGTRGCLLPGNAVVVATSVSTTAELQAMESTLTGTIQRVGQLVSSMLGDKNLIVEVGSRYGNDAMGYFFWRPVELRAGTGVAFHSYGQKDDSVLALLGTLEVFLEMAYPGEDTYILTGYFPGSGAYLEFNDLDYPTTPEVLSWSCADWKLFFAAGLQRQADLFSSILAPGESITFSTDWLRTPGTQYGNQRFFFVAPVETFGDPETWTTYRQEG